MAPVLNLTAGDKSIGLNVRQTRTGPEIDLTNSFIEKTLPVLNDHKRHYALFCEPLLETGFPDIVITTYNPRVFDRWHKERSSLTVSDLKILHHLHFVQGSDSEQIERQLGVDSKNLVRSLEHLLAAGLIRWYAKRWMPRSLKSSFAISNIVAIEAKIKNWSSAFQQADMNRWFASETYVLSPRSKPMKQVLKKSERMGIGIYSMPQNCNAKKIKGSSRGRLPLSYASWLFNEWIGRHMFS
jgi:hypothetical protein